jgi:hypothetical protein
LDRGRRRGGLAFGEEAWVGPAVEKEEDAVDIGGDRTDEPEQQVALGAVDDNGGGDLV